MSNNEQFSNDRVRLSYWGYAEGDSSIYMEPHRHDFFQANFSLDGLCNLETESGNYQLKEGDIIFIAPGVEHKLCYPERYLCYSCKFTGSFPFMPNVLYIPSGNFSRMVIESAKNIVENTFPAQFFGVPEGTVILPDNHYQVLMEYYLTGVLTQLLYSRNEDSVPHKMMDILLGDSRGIFTVSEAAEACQYSRSKFCRTIKEATGLTAKEFLIKLRLKKAVRLLRYSDKKISEISAELGFSNQFHFYDFFKHLKGVSPSEFRKKYLSSLFK